MLFDICPLEDILLSGVNPHHGLKTIHSLSSGRPACPDSSVCFFQYDCTFVFQDGEVEPGANGVQQQPVLQGQSFPVQV